ncbi:SDR family NAD(P)-dependent oxidoreductase [Virgibacillus dokdonensis]|uniref:3-oxoacyl-[acyl-carrier-protein] reductase FabG n=1 Tax=Virgibacillus dokdonensis TaxID=302167 RepID=A0A2K9IWJ2_9BACI|nr:SDR family NAD(P)-dependent oxidoreductase [Virgibacillus dokdonensis]AUJ24129.1 3-oxoacyl-[acyl-carrier-protein] reductase FabG [Virgibacillus dokdonensis]
MLNGKVILITGPNIGIGKSITLRLAKEGTLIGVNGTNQKNIDDVIRETNSFDGKAIGICESIEGMEGGEEILNILIGEYGKIDILFNNAGFNRDIMTISMTKSEWDKVINVNLKGTFSCIRFSLNYMKRSGVGYIINMTSSAGLLDSISHVNHRILNNKKITDNSFETSLFEFFNKGNPCYF